MCLMGGIVCEQTHVCSVYTPPPLDTVGVHGVFVTFDTSGG